MEIILNPQHSSLDEWASLCGLMKSNHWKNGRSAKELGRYILSGEGYLPKEIENIINLKRGIYYEQN